MTEIRVADYFKGTQISRENSEPWKRLLDVANQVGGEVLFDFEGIDLWEPWMNIEFQRFFRNENIRIRVYSSGNVKNTIDVWCKLSGVSCGRIENKDILYIDEHKKEEPTKVNSLTTRVYGATIVNEENKTADIMICNTVGQIGSEATIKAIDETVLKLYQEAGISKFNLEAGMLFIQQDAAQLLATLIMRLRADGIILELHHDDPKVLDSIHLYINTAGTENLSGLQRAKLFTQCIKKNSIGLLTKYKESKGKDAFGRMGKGEVTYCKPAIFRGLVIKDTEYSVVIDEYDVSTFMTKLNYALEHDNQEHPNAKSGRLKHTRRSIKIKDIGVEDLFVGAQFHFNRPVQKDIEDCMAVYKAVDGKITTVMQTIPEFLKDAARDFNLNLDYDELDKAIAETRQCLTQDR